MPAAFWFCEDYVAGQVFQLLDPEHERAVVASGFDLRHRRKGGERTRCAGTLVAHRRHAPQFGHHLSDHCAEMSLRALQLGECVADVDRVDRRRFEFAPGKRVFRRDPDHVGDVLAFARPGLGEIGLVAAEDIDRLRHFRSPYASSHCPSNVTSSSGRSNGNRCPHRSTNARCADGIRPASSRARAGGVT